MIALCAFPLLYLLGIILIPMGLTGWGFDGDPGTLIRIAVVAMGLVCLAFGRYCHKWLADIRDGKRTISDFYS